MHPAQVAIDQGVSESLVRMTWKVEAVGVLPEGADFWELQDAVGRCPFSYRATSWARGYRRSSLDVVR